ncbi:transcriptional regulator [Falsirhodobacter halotolerans]|uniref:transcriptional regulator n=1 Tax=Falsirhodobacter halotolerans TaxID=1146892 RepID=UPI001FD5D938|nr:transcriptional regulator [Falsirhodobacter halotolerans]MCJ8138411.1 transcriptional regulator [Falsirhodobacter halotolerans]
MAKAELNFMEFIQSFRRGELLEMGDKHLNELMDAINETGGNGSITITLPFKVNKAGQIECTPDIAVKKPRRPMGTGIYYATDDGRLSRRDPRQEDWVDDLDDRRMRDRD